MDSFFLSFSNFSYFFLPTLVEKFKLCIFTIYLKELELDFKF